MVTVVSYDFADLDGCEIQGPAHTAPGELISTVRPPIIIRHEIRAFRRCSSSRRNLKTQIYLYG